MQINPDQQDLRLDPATAATWRERLSVTTDGLPRRGPLEAVRGPRLLPGPGGVVARRTGALGHLGRAVRKFLAMSRSWPRKSGDSRSPALRTAPGCTDDAGTLCVQFKRVRREGWATTEQEMSLGAYSVAVPVHCRREVVAAVGVVVENLGRDRGRAVAALQVDAQGIGRSL